MGRKKVIILSSIGTAVVAAGTYLAVAASTKIWPFEQEYVPNQDTPTNNTNDPAGNDSSAASIVGENLTYGKPINSLDQAVTAAGNNWYTTNGMASQFGDKIVTTTAVYDNGSEYAALFYLKDAENILKMGKVTFATAKPTDRTFESFIPADGQWATDENGRSIELEAARILEGKTVYTVELYSKEMTRVAAQFITTLDSDQSHPNTMLLGVEDPVTYTSGDNAGLTGGMVYHVSKLDNGSINLVAQELLVDTEKLNEYAKLIDAKSYVDGYEQFTRVLINGKNTGMTPMQQERFGTLYTPIEWSEEVTYASQNVKTFLDATSDVYTTYSPEGMDGR